MQSENPVSTNEPARPGWRLFPNPTSGEITLNGIGPGYLDVRLFSINGQQLALLYQENDYQGNLLNLSLPEIPPGFYICRVQSGSEIISFKLIKQ
ncbi:MAG: T9SS type A sorting domain-containing protein [Lewinellaceae bacterium]|nr:T9SS type A sorting domain-containing protein [Lewinellaceae bacterium]